MRGIFDNDEAESEEPEELPEEHEERRHDKEVTLSTAAQLGIVFCLLLLCGLCFGAGYWVGHRGSPAPATAANQPATPAPDQEPLQGSDTVPKPSADAQVPPSQPSPQNDGTTPTPDSGANPKPAQSTPAPSHPNPVPPAAEPEPPAPAKSSAPVHTAPAPVHSTPPPTHPASPSHEPEPEYRPMIRPEPPAIRPNPPAYAAASEYMVQIAAVSHSEDAFVLVNALRNRGFTANAQHMPDGLIHVRIGPFATHEAASRVASRLLEQGYNAMVQP